MVRFAASVLAALLALATVSGQTRSSQEALDKVWNLAANPESMAAEPIHVRVRVLEEFVPPEAELSRLMAEVKDHPQHPDRMQVKLYLTRRAGTPTGRLYEFWKKGPVWRVNTDEFPGSFFPVGAKTDFALDGGVQWLWSVGNQLTVFPPGPGATPGYDFMQYAPSFWTTMAIFDTSGLMVISRLTRVAPAPQVKDSGDGKWSTATEIGGESLRFEGTTTDGFRINRIVHEMRVGNDRLVTQLDSRYEGGHVVEVVQLANGRPQNRYVLEAREPISLADLRSAVRVPEDGVPDFVRGAATIGQIDDARGSRRTRTELQNGERVVIASEPSRTAIRSALRRWGLMVVAVVIFGLFLLDRRRRGSGSSAIA